MGKLAYKIPRITDEQIHRSLVELSREFGNCDVEAYMGDASIGTSTYPETLNESLTSILNQKSDLISSFSAHIQRLVIRYYRGGLNGITHEKSPVFDDLIIENQHLDSATIKITARIIELFRPVQLPHPIDSISLLESQRALQESSFSRLQMQLEKVFEQTIDLRAQIDSQLRSKELNLEEIFQQKQSEASQLLQAKIEEVKSREQALEERSKLLDESDNTFARRQIRDRMLSDVSARVQDFGLSDATVAARRPVAIGMAFLCFFLLALLVWTAIELSLTRQDFVQATVGAVETKASSSVSSASSVVQPNTTTTHGSTATPETNGTERLFLWIRFSLLSVGLAASILYYIRWQNQWASTFASTEQSLQQFHIDVNRANWVVETCLEWRKETASDIPAPLIDSLTRGLFAGRESTPTVLHPADELASALMGSASKLSLDINGNKLDIDKPGKIPKTVPTGSSATP